MKTPRAEKNRFSIILQAICYQTLALIRIRFFSRSAFRTATNLNGNLIRLAASISALWRKLAMLAPLRRIVSREIDVQQVKPKYFIYALIDTLECGHDYWT